MHIAPMDWETTATQNELLLNTIPSGNKRSECKAQLWWQLELEVGFVVTWKNEFLGMSSIIHPADTGTRLIIITYSRRLLSNTTTSESGYYARMNDLGISRPTADAHSFAPQRDLIVCPMADCLAGGVST
jgi:hypothetical protein